jgi:glucose uptake protein
MLCWGSWANTFKLSGKWRFELFYFDYSLGVLAAAVIAALTFGSLGNELSFTDNLLITGKTQLAWGIGAGVVFNLANMLLVAAISIAGMAVAFPVGIGLALVVGVIWNYLLNPQGNPALLAGGVALVVIAIILDAMAYSAYARGHKKRVPAPPPAVAAGSTANPPAAKAAPRPSSSRTAVVKKKPVAKKTGGKGILLCLISGVLMGSFYPMVELGKAGENGLGAYSVAFVFAIGVFVSTFVFNVYFMNLPVEGEPVAFSEYFKGTGKQHLLGIFGGMIWCIGTVANFVAASAPKEVQVGPAISYAIGQGATMISALWGLLVWKEFAGAEGRVVRLIALMLFFFLAGLTLLSMAPLFVK